MVEIVRRRASTLLTMAGLVMAFSFFSKIFGLVREQVLAAYFGATSAMDAYNIAFYLPNLIRMLLAETTLSSAFIPVFSSYLARKDRENASVVANTVTNLVIVFFTGITVLLYIFAPNIVSILPGLGESPYLFNLTVSMTRIMLPTLLFMSLTGLAGGLLNSYESFGVPALSPVVF
ncbi:putative peptidoglycan lipid II flippase, partial [Candidatus Hakubella thermalkaliphila]